MNWTAISQASVPILTTLLGLIGFGSRRRRMRSEIEANLKLLEEVSTHEALAHRDALRLWLSNRVALDVGRLCGLNLTNKKPIEWGSAGIALILAALFGLWGWYLNRYGFTPWSVPVIVIGGLFGISFWGHFVNRELPPDDYDDPTADVAPQSG